MSATATKSSKKTAKPAPKQKAAPPTEAPRTANVRALAGALAHVGEITKTVRQNWTQGGGDTVEEQFRGMLEDSAIDLLQELTDADLAAAATWMKDRAKGKATELPDRPTVEQEVAELREPVNPMISAVFDASENVCRPLWALVTLVQACANGDEGMDNSAVAGLATMLRDIVNATEEMETAFKALADRVRVV